ncbi:MAG: type I-U CRISPR-associated protein Csb2 [Myxococcota bacterium]|nr:type I-U CRISPR-associated protein Csb2 [Myxococcota bacterium]
MSNLVLTIRLHDARFHGTPEWPPAPARVFQALVAGVARGNSLAAAFSRAFEWLEGLPPPVIAAPAARRGSRVELFVPNNDADAVGGDPARVGEIRTKKMVQPWLLEEDAVLVYAWPTSAANDQVSAVVEAASSLYQLGRGVDMAWAVGETLDDEALAARLADHRGMIHRPQGDIGERLLCPAPGSLESLVVRQRANAAKFRSEGAGAELRVLFSQPPKPRFLEVTYASVALRSVYVLQETGPLGEMAEGDRLWPWRLDRAAMLIERLRDAAADRLKEAFPELTNVVEQTLIGRKAEAESGASRVERVRIIPLPSIGHRDVDPGIRRIAIEVPTGGPLRERDIRWAFSGLEPYDRSTGVVDPFILAPTDDRAMLERYEAGDHGRDGARRWQTITAAVLPTSAQRRRIEPTRMRAEAKGARERESEEALARDAVRTALRHVGVGARAVAISVQRAPFQARGARAEQFAEGTRFAKERLWHVDLELSEPIRGPLVIGDGRFLGLGVMAPAADVEGILAFSIDAEPSSIVDGDALVHALRRAVMSRVQSEIGNRHLGRYFTGHEDTGEPARSAHLAYQWDPTRGRLLILAPRLVDRSTLTQAETREERDQQAVLERALHGFADLRAGYVGRFRVVRCSSGETEEYMRPSKCWISSRPYSVNRHRKAASVTEALVADVIQECSTRNLPRPAVTVLVSRGVRGLGLQGMLRLEFDIAVAGPIVLGRTRHLGGGLFVRRS